MISREQIVEESVEKSVQAILTAHGYGSKVAMIDSFDAIRGRKLDKTYIAAGFNFDDGGNQAEMGSDLTERRHTVEFFVFGETLTWARNISSVLKFGLQSDPGARLPLYDLATDTIVDYLIVEEATSERQPVPDPEPWQEFVYTVHLRVTDTYYASMVG